MELTNKQIIASENALGKMLNVNLPIKQACHLKKTLESIKKQIIFIGEQRTDLIKKYGSESADGNYEIDKEDKEKCESFFKEYQELLDLKEDIDVRQLTIDELERIELTANEFETIEYIVKQEE